MADDFALPVDIFDGLARGKPDALDAHLVEVCRDIQVGKTLTRLHVYLPAIDAHGRPRIARLAEHLRDRILDYSISRKAINAARETDLKSGGSSATVHLYNQARSLFTNLAKSGEGGELLLFCLTETVLQLPQVLCKMSLKTSSEMHFHGADGVYGSVDSAGALNLHWGESKIKKDVTDAIRDCLKSLAPFLVEPDSGDSTRSRDMLLLNEFAAFDQPDLLEGIRRFLDPEDPASNSLRHNGIALVGFDASFFPAYDAQAIADVIAKAAEEQLSVWSSAVERRIQKEKLTQFDVNFFCIPLPSAGAFRAEFRKALGFAK